MKTYYLLFSKNTDFDYLKSILPLEYGYAGERFYRVDLTDEEIHFIQLSFEVEILYEI